MKLYLVRHGIAVERIGGAILSDSQRPLTEEGKAETRKVAVGLRSLGVKPNLVLSSPLTRARQTAEIMNELLGGTDEVKITDALAPAGAPSDLYRFAQRFKHIDEIMFVGHEPDMGRLAGGLLWATPELEIPFKKAAVCRIDVHDLPPTSPGILKWFITPKIASLLSYRAERRQSE